MAGHVLVITRLLLGYRKSRQGKGGDDGGELHVQGRVGAILFDVFRNCERSVGRVKT